MRLYNYLKRKNSAFIFIFILFRIFRWHYEVKYGISIPLETQIGRGLYIGHFGNIIVNTNVVIGNHLNISQGVTIGVSNRGIIKDILLLEMMFMFDQGQKYLVQSKSVII